MNATQRITSPVETGITNLHLQVRIVANHLSYTVVVETSHPRADRRDFAAWGVGMDRKLAERLVRCIEAGRAFGPVAELLRDVNGKTYLRASTRIYGRTMHRDLKALGF